ncbi:MAG: hypothetical protein ACON4M_07775, partial [Crocinitomicaceae bacterium]
TFNEDDLLNELESSGFDVPDHMEPGKEDLSNSNPNPLEPQFGEKLQVTDQMLESQAQKNSEQEQEDRIKQGVKNFMSAPSSNSETETEDDDDLPPLPQIPDDL